MSNAEHTQSLASPVPAPAHPRQGASRTNNISQTRTTAPSTRRGHIGPIVVGSLATGLTAALLLVLVVFAGGAEPVVTGSAMLGFGLGWAMLAALSVWRTDQPQRWALVPAAYFTTMGAALMLFSPSDGTLTLLGWAPTTPPCSTTRRCQRIPARPSGTSFQPSAPAHSSRPSTRSRRTVGGLAPRALATRWTAEYPIQNPARRIP